MARATFNDGSTEHLNGSEGGIGKVSVLPQKSGYVATREDERMLRRRLARSRIAEAKRLTEEGCRAFWGELDRFERAGRYELDGASEGLHGRGEVER